MAVQRRSHPENQPDCRSKYEWIDHVRQCFWSHDIAGDYRTHDRNRGGETWLPELRNRPVQQPFQAHADGKQRPVSEEQSRRSERRNGQGYEACDGRCDQDSIEMPAPNERREHHNVELNFNCQRPIDRIHVDERCVERLTVSEEDACERSHQDPVLPCIGVPKRLRPVSGERLNNERHRHDNGDRSPDRRIDADQPALEKGHRGLILFQRSPGCRKDAESGDYEECRNAQIAHRRDEPYALARGAEMVCKDPERGQSSDHVAQNFQHLKG